MTENYAMSLRSHLRGQYPDVPYDFREQVAALVTVAVDSDPAGPERVTREGWSRYVWQARRALLNTN